MAIEASQLRNGAILVLQPKGRIEANDAGAFVQPITEHIENGERNIIIDMAEVEAIDTAGVHSLLSIAAQIVIRQGKLVLCGIDNNMLTFLKLTSFDQVVEIADTYEDALKGFR